MHQWIEYSLVYMNGLGQQPYETLVPLSVHFDGGHFVEAGRYRGRLSGTEEQIANAVLSLAMFGVRELTTDDILAIAERLVPTNSTGSAPHARETDTPQYIGPATLDEELRVVRATSDTPFSV